ncbi:unnamed protein product [Closterium sp. Naga37s-1]|nr:unnamed protein product [Closterium sp. Naga37s-1]
MAVEREENELSEAVRGLFATVRGELAAVREELAAVKGEVAAAVAEKAAQESERGLLLESRCVVDTEPVFPATTPLPPLFLLPEFILSSCHTSLCRRTPCIGLAPSAMARMTAVPMLLPGLLLALLLAAAISITPTGRQGRFLSSCPHSSPAALTALLLPSQLSCCPHSSPAALTALLLPSQLSCCPHSSLAALTALLLPSQLSCCPNSSPAALTALLLPSQLSCCPHSSPAALTALLLPSQLSCCPHSSPAALTALLLPSQLSCCPHSSLAALTALLLPSQLSCCPHSSPAALTALLLPKAERSLLSSLHLTSSILLMLHSHLLSTKTPIFSFHVCRIVFLCAAMSCHRLPVLPYAAMCRKHANFQMERVSGAVGYIMASMGGTHEWKEAMEMRMRALGVKVEETRKELEEAERKRVLEMGEVRGQMEKSGEDVAAVKGELAAVQGELAAVKRELAEHKDAMAEQVEARKESSEIREELAALRRDLRRQKDFVKSQFEEAEKRHTENFIELRGQVEERKRELEKAERRRVAEMTVELAAVKRALAGHKDSMIEQLRMAERRRESGLEDLIEEVRKKEDDMRAGLAREREERRREVQELNWPRAMEKLAACRSWVNVEMGIIRNEVDRKSAWEVSAE